MADRTHEHPLPHRRWAARAAALLLSASSLLGAGCSNNTPEAPPPAVGSSTVGAAGGTVDGPDGVRLVVPPDAVAGSTTFRIRQGATEAPALQGLNAVSPVYEITPHEQAFEQPALFSLPRAAATLQDGDVPVLLKASQGGRWRVMQDNQRVPGALSADIDGLSFFVLATCSRAGATSGWVLGAVDCPSNHSLKLELLDSNGTPIAVTPSAQNTLPPLVRVTGPTTLNFRLSWTRPPGLLRNDQVAVVGLPSGFAPGFTSGWGNGLPPGGVQETSIDLVRNFSVTINPEQVSGANQPGGRQLRVAASASYTTTAFQVGQGNVAVGFEFAAAIPITVVYTGTQPSITQQPTPANVAVVENGSFSLSAAASGPNLSYEWRYFQNAADTAVRAAEGSNNLASYTSPAAPLGWNGRLYYVQVCSNRGVATLERCVSSQASTLTVSAFSQAPAFTNQPAARDILEGESTSFTAAVTGAPTPSLQWHHSVSCSNRPLLGLTCTGTPVSDGPGSGPLAGATVSGSTSATLNLASVPLGANGLVWSLAASQPGMATATWSSTAALTVRARPVAASFAQPLTTPRSVQQNGSIDFSFQASGTAPISAFWFLDGAALGAPGALSTGRCAGAVVSFPADNTLRLANVPLSCDSSTVRVELQNVQTPAGARPASSALLNVSALPTAPAVVAQPQNSSVNEGAQATLTTGYSGTGPVTLSLQRLSGSSWVDTGISATSTTCASPCSLQTPALAVGNNGAMFRVHLSNALGAADSNAVGITVTMTRAPAFTTQPANTAADAGLSSAAGTASFGFALAADSGSFTWQWLLNGQPLADGTGVAGNGVLQSATVQGASGTLGTSTPGTLTVSNLDLAANGAPLSVRVTRSSASQSLASTSSSATLTVNTGLPANALTATQVVAGYEWSLVLRPDGSVWAWGGLHRSNGSVSVLNTPTDPAWRPVRMYPAVLNDVRAIAGRYDNFWALTGNPGSTASRVLHWGAARYGSDGRGTDGQGSITGNTPPVRYNEATPVEVLERVGGVAQPVDRVCAIAGGPIRLALIRAVDGAGNTTSCNPGAAKTVWMVGSWTEYDDQSKGIAQPLTGLTGTSPPAFVFFGQTSSGSPPLVVGLEDGRLFALGGNNYNGLAMGLPAPSRVGGINGLQELPSTWGTVRSVGMSFYYSLFAVRADGSVVVSGYNGGTELGLGNVPAAAFNGPLPVLAETCSTTPCSTALTGVSTVVSNEGQTTLALQNGRLLGWGSPGSSLLGPGLSGNQPYPRPVPTTLLGLSGLSSANRHALVVGPGGAVYSWGSGARGALGDGVSGSSRTVPTLVTVP